MDVLKEPNFNHVQQRTHQPGLVLPPGHAVRAVVGDEDEAVPDLGDLPPEEAVQVVALDEDDLAVPEEGCPLCLMLISYVL